MAAATRLSCFSGLVTTRKRSAPNVKRTNFGGCSAPARPSSLRARGFTRPTTEVSRTPRAPKKRKKHRSPKAIAPSPINQPSPDRIQNRRILPVRRTQRIQKSLPATVSSRLKCISETRKGPVGEGDQHCVPKGRWRGFELGPFYQHCVPMGRLCGLDVNRATNIAAG